MDTAPSDGKLTQIIQRSGAPAQCCGFQMPMALFHSFLFMPIAIRFPPFPSTVPAGPVPGRLLQMRPFNPGLSCPPGSAAFAPPFQDLVTASGAQSDPLRKYLLRRSVLLPPADRRNGGFHGFPISLFV